VLTYSICPPYYYTDVYSSRVVNTRCIYSFSELSQLIHSFHFSLYVHLIMIQVLERENAGQNGNNNAAGSGGSIGGGSGDGAGGGEAAAAANELPAWFSKPQLDRPPTPEVMR